MAFALGEAPRLLILGITGLSNSEANLDVLTFVGLKNSGWFVERIGNDELEFSSLALLLKTLGGTQ